MKCSVFQIFQQMFSRCRPSMQDSSSSDKPSSSRWEVTLKNGGRVSLMAAIPIVAAIQALSSHPEVAPWLTDLHAYLEGQPVSSVQLREICEQGLATSLEGFYQREDVYRQIVRSGLLRQGKTLCFTNPFRAEDSQRIDRFLCQVSQSLDPSTLS